jgi:hypothetical protein
MTLAVGGFIFNVFGISSQSYDCELQRWRCENFECNKLPL